jgi:uncharacterized membrane protein YphA (DoxX/SURF4 family)
MSFLLTLHGEIRWLVALVAVIAIIKFAIGWLNRSAYQGMDRGLMAAFTGLLDLNLLLGLLLLIFGGGFTPARIEHAVTMLIAVVIAHASAAWRRSDNASLKFRNNLFAILGALLFVIIGVVRLRGGWLF